jgi:hypothetical protein
MVPRKYSVNDGSKQSETPNGSWPEISAPLQFLIDKLFCDVHAPNDE